jgi:hypothetical protein
VSVNEAAYVMPRLAWMLRMRSAWLLAPVADGPPSGFRCGGGAGRG